MNPASHISSSSYLPHSTFTFTFDTPSSIPFQPQPHTVPTSPPAPHRRAPRPPQYKPRRSRSRHLRMCEPARNGLFTVCEADEDSDMESQGLLARYSIRISSTCLSSDAFRTEIDFPQDVDVDMEDEEVIVMSDTHRLSWSTQSGNSETEVETPHNELDDPFAMDSKWDTIPLEEDEEVDDEDEKRVMAEIKRRDMERYHDTLREIDRNVSRGENDRPRRPPPLNLVQPTRSKSYHPFATPYSDDMPTPRTSKPTPLKSLLPSLPILSAHERPPRFPSPTTPTRSRSRRHKSRHGNDPINLETALEDLLSSCGEDLPDLSSSEDEIPLPQFPLPPSRTPTTPQRRHGVRFPSPPSPVSRREVIQTPEFRGDHSFLFNLSRSDSPKSSLDGSTGSSGSSKGCLPKRMGIPVEWARFGGEL